MAFFVSPASPLRRARLRQELSLDEAALGLAISAGYLSRLERRFVPLTPRLASRASHFYRTKIDPAPRGTLRLRRGRRASEDSGGDVGDHRGDLTTEPMTL